MAMTSAETKILVRKKTVADMAFPKTVSQKLQSSGGLLSSHQPSRGAPVTQRTF
jgi:hypothetical protein